MTTSDRVLTVLAAWLDYGGFLPPDVSPRLRDIDGDLGALEVILDADEPEEHELLRGVERLEGEIRLDISADDSSAAGRRAMLSDLAEFYEVDEFMEWANDPAEGRGLEAGQDVTFYDLRVAAGGSWENEDRRCIGRIQWSAVAAPCLKA